RWRAAGADSRGRAPLLRDRLPGPGALRLTEAVAPGPTGTALEGPRAVSRGRSAGRAGQHGSVLPCRQPPGAASADQNVQGHFGEWAGEVITGLDGLAVRIQCHPPDLGEGH